MGLGRDVEFLVTLDKQTPDLRIHDLGFPAVVECKFQQRLSAYELREFSAMRDVFDGVRSYYGPRGVIGNLAIQFRQPPVEIGVQQIVDAAIECQAGMSPYRTLKYEWGDLSLSPLDPTITLPGDTRLYSPDFLNFVFGWDSDTTEYDGILATVRNHRAMRVARAELPFSLQWRVEHENVLDRKARSIASQLAEAHSQIPVGEGGFLYLAYEEQHRNAIADRRTEHIIQLVTNWEVRKRGIRPLRIVINRLYPRPIHEGRPDLIESAIRISPYDEHIVS